MTTYKFHAKFGVDDIFSKMSFMHTVELYTLGKLNDLHFAGLCFLFFTLVMTSEILSTKHNLFNPKHVNIT